MPQSQNRIDYNQIAHLYDEQPYREKTVDSDLLSFLKEKGYHLNNSGKTWPEPVEGRWFRHAHPTSRYEKAHTKAASPAIVDMGCGTGNQLIANGRYVGTARMIGLDLFEGMLQQAQRKGDNIAWVQADSAYPPLLANQFDYISNQFSFHHVKEKRAMLRAVYRMLRPGGRFVMTNICPREMTGWLYYRYFSAAYAADLADFLPVSELLAQLLSIGFTNIIIDLNHIREETDLQSFSHTVQRRDICSQLITIPNADYQAGLQKLQADLNQAGGEILTVQSEVCILTLNADK